MKQKLLLLLLTLAFIPVQTPAPIYMKIDGIDGEVRDATHPNSIEIESFSWGMSNTTTTSGGGGAGAGKVTMQDIHFVKKVDKSSPALMTHCATGRYIPKVELILRKAGDKPVEYYKITLENVLVSSYNTSGSGGDDRPTESISLNFTKITFDYRVQKDDGTLEPPVTFTYNKVIAQ